MTAPLRFDRSADAAAEIFERVDGHARVGTPLGIGKPVVLLNALVARALEDPTLELDIFTALSLERPRTDGSGLAAELERRLLGPITDKVFGDWPDLDYVRLRREGSLPANIRVSEFYFEPGSFLRHAGAQQDYASSNYSHVVRDVTGRGLNVLAQMVAPGLAADRLNLSSNPDLSLDLIEYLAARRERGEPAVVAAQVNRRLPGMPGDPEVPLDRFDLVVDEPSGHHDLPAPPNPAVSLTDHLIGFWSSLLVRDGGTLQLGIGALGDAIAWHLLSRHQRNAEFRELLEALGGRERFGSSIDRVGGTAPFERGLYGNSEMLVDGFLDLRRAGILTRRVYPHAGIQRALDEGRIFESIDDRTLPTLVDVGALPRTLDDDTVRRLVALGLLPAGSRIEAGELMLSPEERTGLDLTDPTVVAALRAAAPSERLRGGVVLHAGFFLGPREFYQRLRDLSEAERESIAMTSIAWINEARGEEDLKRAQRRDARFINSGLNATLLGSVASDALEDGRVLSGVGGQYNFVAQAHDLPGARSILMIRATRESGGRTTSNILWSYGHTTIPRHLRDFVVTEYGIADLRGRTDREVVEAMLAIADSRFQEGLVRDAIGAGKLPRDYRLPDAVRSNTPERLRRDLAPFREPHEGRRALLDRFPFGTDLDPEEIALAGALRRMSAALARRRPAWPGIAGLRQMLAPPPEAEPYLERMRLDRPRNARERLLRRAVVYALVTDGHLPG